MQSLKILSVAALFGALVATTGCSTSGKTTGQVVDDTALTSEVKAKLVGNDFMEGMGANIETHKGIVQLGGFIEDASKARQLADIAASVDGVTSVDNQLHEQGRERSAGQAIDDGITTSRVTAALADADIGDSLKINVDTYGGVVLLTGFVATEAQKVRAGDLAAADRNTRNVINGIYVYE